MRGRLCSKEISGEKSKPRPGRLGGNTPAREKCLGIPYTGSWPGGQNGNLRQAPSGRPTADRCLGNGIRKGLSRCLPVRRTARTGGFGAARGCRGERIGLQQPTQRRSDEYSNRLGIQDDPDSDPTCGTLYSMRRGKRYWPPLACCCSCARTSATTPDRMHRNKASRRN